MSLHRTTIQEMKLTELVQIVLSVAVFLIASLSLLSQVEYEIINQKIFVSMVAATLGIAAALLVSQVMSRKKTSIFLSYPNEMEDIATKLGTELKENNFEVVVGDTIINPGDNIKKEVKKAIEDIDTLIVLLNEKSKKSDYINTEIKTAIKNKKRIIPLLTENNKKLLPKSINSLRFEVISEETEEESIKNFIAKIKTVDSIE